MMTFERINPITGEVASRAPAMKATDIGAIARYYVALAPRSNYLCHRMQCITMAWQKASRKPFTV
jgi:hypothetical protein